MSKYVSHSVNKYLLRFTAVLSLGFVFLGCQSTKPIQSGVGLEAILEQRSQAERARDQYRHPKETITFFGVEPGMTVLEVLPGAGWYSKILAPYLGENGTLHAVNYADEMWDMFGFFSAENIEKRKQQMVDWPKTVKSYNGSCAFSRGFAFGQIDKSLESSVDAVLFIRALHNLNRFEKRAGMRTAALKEIYSVLKPGGIVGVVQHQAPEAANDSWASGQNGYLKRSAVIAMFEQAGFTFVGDSAINQNAKDRPIEGDFVWRLPPSLRGTKESPQKLATVMAIGESDRMTLKFVKPD